MTQLQKTNQYIICRKTRSYLPSSLPSLNAFSMKLKTKHLKGGFVINNELRFLSCAYSNTKISSFKVENTLSKKDLQ